MTQPTATEPGSPGLLPGETENLYEVVDGQRKELEPMGPFEGVLASTLSGHLGAFAREHKLGAVVNEMLFVLDARRDRQRRPDVAFVSYQRWPETTIARTNAWNAVPDLTVEVVSPTNLAEEIDAKLTDYFTAGVRLAWVIYPDSGRVYVYDSPDRCRVLKRSDELDGGDVLPGFRLPIETLFEAVTRPD